MKIEFSMKKRWVSISIVSFLFVILYLPLFLALVQNWIDDHDYSHGFFVPLISAYFVWKKKNILQSLSAEPNNVGLIILIGGLLLYSISLIGDIAFTARLSMLIVLAGIIIYLSGKTIFKELLFPWAFLIFMIPIPYVLITSIAFSMRLFASKWAALLIKLIGMPVMREGNIIHLSNTSLEVGDPCSGLRSLVSLLALGTIYAYVSQKSNIKRMILSLSTIPIAIIANIFRIAATALLAYVYGEKVAQGFLHEFSGIVVFIIALLLLIMIGTILKRIPLKGQSVEH